MHETDYKNLNLFEAATAGLAMAGFLLVSLIVFLAIPPRLQNNILAATNIFDIHEQASQSVASIGSVFETENIFLDKFYVAFTELAVIPSDSFQESATMLSQAGDYVRHEVFLSLDSLQSLVPDQTSTPTLFNQSGNIPKVAGVSVDLSSAPAAVPPDCSPPALLPTVIPANYRLPPPDLWQAIKQELLTTWLK